MHDIADFNDNEQWTIETTLRERFGSAQKIDLALAESEIRLSSSDRELTVCPVIYWEVNQCNFVIIKSADQRYRCQFFYRVHQQFSTGIDEFDDLTECVVTLLQTQSDHERKLNIAKDNHEK